MNTMSHLILVLMVTTVATALPAADSADVLLGIKIPSGDQGHVAKDLLPRLAVFNHATLTGVWTDGRTEPAFTESMAVIATMEHQWSTSWTGLGAFDVKSLLSEIDVALAAGSHDPMVLYLDGRYRRQSLGQRQKRFHDAQDAFVGSPYPAIRRFYNLMQLIQCLANTAPPDTDAIAGAWTAAEAELMAGLKELPTDDYPAVAGLDAAARGLLVAKGFLGLPGMTDRVLRDLSDPKVPPWWSAYLTGIVQVRLAYMARGNGWANTVTAEGWREFAIHQKLAETVLSEIWKRYPDRPEAAIEMIAVAMGRNRESGDEVTWFNRAVSARMDAMAAYENLSTAWWPREGGSYEQMLVIGQASVDTERYDTEVPWQLIIEVRAIWEDAHQLNQPRPTVLNRDLYDRCKQVAIAYEAYRHLPENSHAYALAVVAWMCGLPEETVHQLDLAPPHASKIALGILQVTPAQLRALAAAPAGAPPAALPDHPEDDPMGAGHQGDF